MVKALPWIGPDFGVIVLLLFINSSIGFYEEGNAGNAIKALMDSLAACVSTAGGSGAGAGADGAGAGGRGRGRAHGVRVHCVACRRQRASAAPDPRAKVNRTGSWFELEFSNLIPGDMIPFKVGDIVPAEYRLTEANSVSFDQSSY